MKILLTLIVLICLYQVYLDYKSSNPPLIKNTTGVFGPESTIRQEYKIMCDRIDKEWPYTDEQIDAMESRGVIIGKYPTYHDFRESYLSKRN